jgi:hypothetical protein
MEILSHYKESEKVSSAFSIFQLSEEFEKFILLKEFL